MAGSRNSTAVGVAAQDGASIDAIRLELQANEGPGLYSTSRSSISCAGCTIGGSQFAGAAVTSDGILSNPWNVRIQ